MASYCLLLIALFGFVSMAVTVEKHQNTLLWFYSKAVEIDFCVLIFQNVIFFFYPKHFLNVTLLIVSFILALLKFILICCLLPYNVTT